MVTLPDERVLKPLTAAALLSVVLGTITGLLALVVAFKLCVLAFFTEYSTKADIGDILSLALYSLWASPIVLLGLICSAFARGYRRWAFPLNLLLPVVWVIAGAVVGLQMVWADRERVGRNIMNESVVGVPCECEGSSFATDSDIKADGGFLAQTI